MSKIEIAKKALEIFTQINEIQNKYNENSDSNKVLKETGSYEPSSVQKKSLELLRERNSKELKAIGDFFKNGNSIQSYPVLYEFVTALNKDVLESNKESRIRVGGKSTDEKMLRNLFNAAFDPKNMPDAKWPSNYTPFLMQQLAINLACNQVEFSRNLSCSNDTVFSVNGPPGTGKTTLLKEIVADSVVKRALKLCKLKTDSGKESCFNPVLFDSVFEPPEGNFLYASCNMYKPKDALLEDGIIVVSSNNKAVENVSLDLPVDSVVKSKLEKYQTKFGTNFDFFQTELKNYYSKHKDDLDKKELDKIWGLISVPLGNSDNIFNALKDLVYPILNSSRIYSADGAKKRFLAQYEKVQRMKEQLCAAKKRYEIECLIKDKKAEVKQKEREMAAIAFPEIGLNWFSALYRPHVVQPKVKQIKQLIREKKKLENDKKQIRKEINFLVHIFEELPGSEEFLKANPDKYASESKDGMCYLSSAFFDDLSNKTNTEACLEANKANPWTTEEFNTEREYLFFAALEYYYSEIFSSVCIKENFNQIHIEKIDKKDNDTFVIDDDCTSEKTDEYISYTPKPNKWVKIFSVNKSYNWNKAGIKYIGLKTLHTIIPVVSSTFDSISNYPLQDTVEENSLVKKTENKQTVNGSELHINSSYLDIFGTVVVDEAGQAMPHKAVGAFLRARRAVVVGDPLQIPPVTLNVEEIEEAAEREEDVFKNYYDIKNSVQSVADAVNPFGGYLNTIDDDMNYLWLGCPLSVHTRCVDPMFSISNALCYDFSMLKYVSDPDENNFRLSESCWIDIAGGGSEESHYNNFQAEKLLEILREKKDNERKFYIISPFKDVETNLLNLGIEYFNADNCGTVHKFQGKQADEVFFVLGCGDCTKEGTYSWVSKNIINVAVTRAKYRLYIIGDKTKWTTHNPYMNQVALYLDEYNKNRKNTVATGE